MSDPVLLLTGPPGAGKTTVARELAARSDRGVHVESDVFFHFIGGGYIAPWRPESHQQNLTVMQAVAATAGSYAAGGYFTIVDGIINPEWFLEPLRDALKESGHHVSCAVLRPSLGTCLSRATGRAGGRLSDPRVIAQLWDGFADLGPLEEHVIQLGAENATQVADIVLEKVRGGSLAV